MSSRVELRVSGEVLRHLLRLPDDTVISKASVRDGVVSLWTRSPDFPKGAVEMTPTYRRVNDMPDPIVLESVDFLMGNGEVMTHRFAEGNNAV